MDWQVRVRPLDAGRFAHLVQHRVCLGALKAGHHVIDELRPHWLHIPLRHMRLLLVWFFVKTCLRHTEVLVFQLLNTALERPVLVP